MQIRIRKHTLALIRTVYDPTIKRGRSVTIGTCDVTNETIPPDIDAQLRPAEREQLLVVLARFRTRREAELEELAGRLLPVTLRRATRWYDRQKKCAELGALAKSSRDEFTGLLGAMVRAGVGRTRQRKKANA